MKRIRRLSHKKRFFNVTLPEPFRFTLVQWRKNDTFKLQNTVVQSYKEFFYFLPYQPARILLLDPIMVRKCKYPFQLMNKVYNMGYDWCDVTIHKMYEDTLITVSE